MYLSASGALFAWQLEQMSRAPAPEFVSPMKATLVSQLPVGDEWLYEIKWDGYRSLAAKRGHSVRLLSLKNKNLSSDFPTVMKAVRGVAADTVLIDGEIVAVDKRGRPSFRYSKIAPRSGATGRSSIMRLIY